MSNNVFEPVNIPSSAYDEVLTANNTPTIQLTAHYGILDDALTAELGGTTAAANNKFSASTGTGASNVAAVLSRREAQYRAGQGLTCRLSAIFNTGVDNNTQQAGFINSEGALAFGYNGSEFGILRATGGALESQLLTITTPASLATDATITIDGNAFTVPLTSGTEEHNAFEIAVSLTSQVAGWRFTSNGATVRALAQLPDFGSGLFAFSHATAAAAWAQDVAAALPAETWINKADWNVNPDIDINPQLGNIYQIQMEYLGFGGITFSIEDPETSKMTVVHVINYANTSTETSVSAPVFRVGWASRNTGNTTSVTVSGASAATFNEGRIILDAATKGLCSTQAAVNTTATNILSFRNRIFFNGKANRAEIIPLLLDLASDTTKTAIFEIFEDPTYSGSPAFEFFDEQTSLLEYSTTSVTVSGGKRIGCFLVTSGASKSIDLSKVLNFISPMRSFAISARVSSGGASDMDASINWLDDL